MKPLLKQALISIVAGSLYALAYPSPFSGGFFPLLFISVPLFVWLIEKSGTLKESLILIFCYNLGLNVTGYYWIPKTLQEFGQLPLPVCYILAVLFSLILQPHWWAYAIWKKYRPQWNWRSESGILATALIMTLLERYIPQQFPSFTGSPWLHLSPYLGLAAVVGVTGFSFMTFWFSLEAIVQIQQKKIRPFVGFVFAVFVVTNLLMPLKKAPSADELKVRIVQANVGNFMKVSSEKGDEGSFQEINNRYKRLSIAENGFRPDLIIWPETAFPDTFYGQSTLLAEVFNEVQDVTNAEMLIGGYEQDASKPMFEIYESVFNSSILISDKKVKTSYHKNILIPFGETLPFGPLNKKIVEFVPAVSLFASGVNPPKMETKKGYRFVTPICYEVLETGYMRELLNQYGNNRLIINHTNDSWYGDTAEPYQHLFLSKWRPLEFNLPMVRSTNTGVTSVVFADGSESEQLGIGKEGQLDVVVPLGNGKATIYQTWGIFILLSLFAVLFGITWLREKKKNRL